MRKINEIIIHCAETRPDQYVTAEHIDQWHKDKGWKGIGYHYFIRTDGIIDMGRPISSVGAHCYGHNQHSIGICYAGGVIRNNGTKEYKDTRTPEQIRSLYLLIKILLSVYPTIIKISGHNDYSAKECPCFNVHDEFDLFLQQVREQQKLYKDY